MQKATVKALCVMLTVWCIGLATTTAQGAEEGKEEVTLTGRLIEENDDNDAVKFVLFAEFDYYQLILTDEQMDKLAGLGMTKVKLTGTVSKDNDDNLQLTVSKFEVLKEDTEEMPEEEDPLVVE